MTTCAVERRSCSRSRKRMRSGTRPTGSNVDGVASRAIRVREACMIKPVHQAGWAFIDMTGHTRGWSWRMVIPARIPSHTHVCRDGGVATSAIGGANLSVIHHVLTARRHGSGGF